MISPAAAHPETRPSDAAATRRRPSGRIAIAVGALAAIGGCGWLTWRYGLWMFVLPPFIVEGPMVQQPTEISAIVVWFMSRPADCTFSYAPVAGGDSRTAAVVRDGRRCVARLDGLSPASSVDFRIATDDQTLVSARLDTARPAGAAFSFLVFGDSGYGKDKQYALAARMAELAPDLVVHTGDLIYPAGQRHDYADKFFNAYAPLLSRVAFWPSLGNHDVAKKSSGGQPYRDVFELPTNGPAGLPPENNYWFDYADARFVIIDSNLDEQALGETVAPWLRTTLADSAAAWKFVVFHHPPYTHAKHSPSQSVRNALVPVFEDAKVDIVFNGHDHLYERTHPMRGEQVVAHGEGVVYVVSGAGGASLYEAKPAADRPAYFAFQRDDVHSFTQVTIEGRRLRLKQFAIDGSVFDEWAREK